MGGTYGHSFLTASRTLLRKFFLRSSTTSILQSKWFLLTWKYAVISPILNRKNSFLTQLLTPVITPFLSFERATYNCSLQFSPPILSWIYLGHAFTFTSPQKLPLPSSLNSFTLLNSIANFGPDLTCSLSSIWHNRSLLKHSPPGTTTSEFLLAPFCWLLYPPNSQHRYVPQFNTWISFPFVVIPLVSSSQCISPSQSSPVFQTLLSYLASPTLGHTKLNLSIRGPTLLRIPVNGNSFLPTP